MDKFRKLCRKGDIEKVKNELKNGKPYYYKLERGFIGACEGGCKNNKNK